MSRYLTPFRIALLHLITVYSDGFVPSSSSIPVLSFIVSYILPAHSRSKERVGSVAHDDFSVSVERLQKATIFHASAIPGRTVWDLLLKSLWATDSLDDLHTFFDDLPSLVAKPTEEGSNEVNKPDPQRPRRMLLSRNSPLGAFVRRAQLEFTRLQFHDGNRLWKDLIVFRRPTLGQWTRRNPGVGSYSFDSNLQAGSIDAEGKLAELIYGDLSDNCYEGVLTSTDDMERLLDYQIDRMQRVFPKFFIFGSASAERCHRPRKSSPASNTITAADNG